MLPLKNSSVRLEGNGRSGPIMLSSIMWWFLRCQGMLKSNGKFGLTVEIHVFNVSVEFVAFLGL